MSKVHSRLCWKCSPTLERRDASSISTKDLTFNFQVKELGLMPKYRQDDAFKLRVKKLAALAFIPVSNLVATFESLSTSFLNDELRLLAYFENTWIGQPVGGRRLPPLYPHHMWNVRDRSGTGSSRTTNALEAFHHTFNSLLTCQHPTIWSLWNPSKTCHEAQYSKSAGDTPSDLQYKRGDVTRGLLFIL